MIRVLIVLLVTTLQTRREEVGRVGTDLAAEKIERVTEPEVDVLLNDVERNAAELAHITFFHQLRRATDHAPKTGVANKHVMRFLGEHEVARARERLKARFGECGKLILAVAIRKHREGEKVEPIVTR